MQEYINVNYHIPTMRKITLSLLFSFALLLPLSMLVKPIFAQEESITYDEEVYDTQYDNSYYDYSYELSDTDNEEGVLTSLIALFFSGVMLVCTITVSLTLYVYISLTLMAIAKKLKYENAWYAWIPILNMIMLFELGDQNPMLLFLLLIPGIGELIIMIFSVIALMNISTKRGYDKMLGLLALIPIARYVLLGILAWGKNETVKTINA